MTRALRLSFGTGEVVVFRLVKVIGRSLGAGRGLAVTAVLLGSIWAVSPAHAYIYWTTDSFGTIGRANLDGTQENDSLLPFNSKVTAVAATNTDLYWANAATNTIGRSTSLGGDVNENFINRVRSGQPVTIRLNAYPDWEMPGEVIAIIPTADRTKATVKVRVGFKHRDARILPEMGARVSFLENAALGGAQAPEQRAILVAPEAVQVNGDTGSVFVLHADKVEQRTVKLGAQSAQGQIVLSGVAVGAKLAIAVDGKLSDGAKVRIE